MSCVHATETNIELMEEYQDTWDHGSRSWKMGKNQGDF